ncbi:MAG: ECF transporter S component [Lachnospiraceae bacterium]|nr:ECF transporter S component [Lachnospiraceae bacterium]
MNNKIKKISIVALFSALSAILMYFDFPLPIAPTFMKMDLSELPVIIGGFVLGPFECISIAVFKVLIKFVIKGTSTMFLGELANIIGSISYALPASIIYKALKTKERAVIGMIIGIVLASVVCTLCNALFLFPLYIKVFHMSEEVIIKMCSTIIPFIDSMTKVYLFSVLPFNIVKFSIASIITYIFYKNISKHIKSILS